jgi:hypothetical protein
MPNNDPPVIVSYQRLNERLGKVLENPQAILDAPKNPAPPGYEAFESDDPPLTDEEAAQLFESYSRALKILEAGQRDQGVLAAPDDQFTSLMQSYLAETSLQAGKVDDAAGGGLEAQFDEHDILGWAKSLFTWVKKIRPHKWQVASSIPDSLPNSVRVAILGDWGTGLYGAPSCAHSIENDPAGYGFLLHLGDVYYSGTDKEVADRFLDLWPKNANAINRACNSNHEMYTGGYAYFNQTLRKFNQPASYFALQSDHWLLVGLDSAYKEWELANDQVTWLKGLLANAENRRVVLFSHHQPFSWKETPNSKLQSAVADLLTQRKIFAWYFGHEHRCMIYDQHPLWNIYGRCVGHSGYPYFTDKTDAGSIVEHGPQDSVWRRVESKNMVPGGLILEGPNAYIKKHENNYGPNGYMTLELNDSHLNEIVQMPDGTVAYNRQLI